MQDIKSEILHLMENRFTANIPEADRFSSLGWLYVIAEAFSRLDDCNLELVKGMVNGVSMDSDPVGDDGEDDLVVPIHFHALAMPGEDHETGLISGTGCVGLHAIAQETLSSLKLRPARPLHIALAQDQVQHFSGPTSPPIPAVARVMEIIVEHRAWRLDQMTRLPSAPASKPRL